jgi:rubrerythrin
LTQNTPRDHGTGKLHTSGRSVEEFATLTVYDETQAGAEELRRQIKFSGVLKMDETACTPNAIVGEYTHPMGTVCPVCRGIGYTFRGNGSQIICPKCNSRGVLDD